MITLHPPWDYNEVPVLLAEAFKSDIPIISLFVTRPAYPPIPDREKLGIPSHFAAAKGAYTLRIMRKEKREVAPCMYKGPALYTAFSPSSLS